MNLRPASILSRILWLQAATSVIIALTVAMVVDLFLDSTADRLQRQTLNSHAEMLARALKPGTGGTWQVRLDRATALAAEGGAGFRYLIVDDHGRTIYGSAKADFPTAEIPRHDTPTYFRERSRQAFYSGLSKPVIHGHARAWIVTVQDLEYPDNIVDDILDQFPAYGFVLILSLLVLLLVANWITVRRALAPVIRATNFVKRLDLETLDARVPEAGLPSEVLPLARATNEALERLVRAYKSQRDFTADAAHELRTPLSILRMKVEDLPDAAWAEMLGSDVDSLTRLVNQLLEIAEMEGSSLASGDVVDLSAIATDHVATFAPYLFRGGRTIEMVAPDSVTVQGNAYLIGRALDALLENAGTHTPVGSQIIVTVSTDGRLTVEDDGPGIDPVERQLVFRRFWRRNRAPAGNSGLGLAIVARVAEAHETTAFVEQSSSGGAAFSIHFHQVDPPGRS